MNNHPIPYNFDGPLIGKHHPKGSVDELGRRITVPQGWVDGGDTCQRVGMYYFGLKAFEKLLGGAAYTKFVNAHQLLFVKGDGYLNAIRLLECKDQPGVYKRHPDKDLWYSACNVMSRDQCFPLVLSMAIRGARKALWRFFLAHLKRGLLFTTNTRKNGSTAENHGTKFKESAAPLSKRDKWVLDNKIPQIPTPDGYRNYNWKLPDFTGPTFWAFYIRAFDLWFLYPLLLVLDLEFLLGSYIISRDNEDIDTLKHNMTLIYFDMKYKTPWVWLANKYINKSKHLIDKMKIYFGKSGEPYFMTYIYEPLLKRVLGK